MRAGSATTTASMPADGRIVAGLAQLTRHALERHPRRLLRLDTRGAPPRGGQAGLEDAEGGGHDERQQGDGNEQLDQRMPRLLLRSPMAPTFDRGGARVNVTVSWHLERRHVSVRSGGATPYPRAQTAGR